MLEYATAQVLLELAHHEAGKATGFFRPLAELGPMLRDDPVQEALLGVAASMAVGARVVRPQERDRRSDSHERKPAMIDDRDQLAAR